MLAYVRYARGTEGKYSVFSIQYPESSSEPPSRIEHPAATPATGVSRFTFHVSRITHHASFFYALALLLFALGLMSKPMVVTLPCVLLLLDFWPLRRFPSAGI